jgi:predicted secreted protein
VELTDEDNGRTVTVAPGSVITVRLAEARMAGFKWALHGDGGGSVALTSEELIPSAMPGGRAMHEFRFVAANPGVATLRLVHSRPWSPDDTDAGHWQARVEVIEATEEHTEP